MRKLTIDMRSPVLRSLQSQFPQFSYEDIRDVLNEANRHGGIAARRLRERVMRSRYKSLEHSVLILQRKYRQYRRRNRMPAFPTLYGLGRTIEFSVLFEKAKQILSSTSLQHQHNCALRIQCLVRIFISKSRLSRQRRLISSVLLQRYARGFMSRNEFRNMKEERERRRRLESCIKLQALWRGVQGRIVALLLYRNICARRIQSTARVYVVVFMFTSSKEPTNSKYCCVNKFEYAHTPKTFQIPGSAYFKHVTTRTSVCTAIQFE